MAGSHQQEGAVVGRGVPCCGRPQVESPHLGRAQACGRARHLHFRQQEGPEARALPPGRALRAVRR
eukprot:6167526-Alexandrium_andersonii.AAC.1